MDTDLALRLTEIVKSIGDAKYDIMSEVSVCKRDIAVIKTKLNNHLEQVDKTETTKGKSFDRKTVVIGLLIGAVAVYATVM